MSFSPMIAQVADLPEAGSGGIIFWLIGAVVIVGLFLVISRTRKRSYDAYWERKRREEQQRLDDPDMARPSDDEAA